MGNTGTGNEKINKKNKRGRTKKCIDIFVIKKNKRIFLYSNKEGV